MAPDFPPNLDDEAAPENMSEQASVDDNAATHSRAQVLIEPNKSVMIYDTTLLGTRTNGNGAIDVNMLPVYSPLAFSNVGFQAVSVPFPMYNPFPPTHLPVQSFDIRATRAFPRQQNWAWPVQVTGGWGMNSFSWKCEGTGVFLPDPHVAGSVVQSQEAGGSGIFLGHSLAPTTRRRKKRSGKNRHRGFVAGDEAVEKQEETQLPPEIRLPQDWTY